MCWAMGESNFQINGNATGCFKFSGTTFDAPGEYQLRIIVDATTTFLGFPTNNTNQNLAVQGIRYYVRVKFAGDQCAPVDTNIVGNKTTPPDTLSAPTITGITAVCAAGDSTVLRVVPDYNYYGYLWSNGSQSDSIKVSVGTYSVTVYGNCNRDSSRQTVTIGTVRDTITSSGPTTFCQGNNVTLSVPTGGTYSWSNGATTNSISPGAAGTYQVTVTSPIGCTAVSQGVTLTVNPAPADSITASGPLAFCPGGSVALSGPSGLAYQWSNGNTSQSITASQNSTYTLIVTNGNNCSAISAPVTVSVYGLPDASVTAGGSTTFCPGDSVILSGQGGYTYLWSNGDTTQSIAAMQAGGYTLTVTNSNHCTATSPATTISLLPAPPDSVTASGPLTLCTGGSVVLSAPSGLAYVWSTGSNAQRIQVSQSGTYTVTLTNGDNCSAVSAPTVVTVNATPSDTITSSGPTTFCSGLTVTLSAITGYTYHWSTGATSQSINVTQAGNYLVTITSGSSCSATSTPVTVTVNPNPSNTVTTSGPASFCGGGHVTLTAAAGLNYLWSNSASTQAISVTQSGSYSVTVSNANNCSASSTPVSVTVLPAPSGTVTANGPTSFCPGGNVRLTATAGYNYVWSNSATTQIITVTQGGTYTVTATNTNQCTAVFSSPVIVVNPATNISTQPANQVTCINGPVTFNVTAAGDSLTYQWQKNGTNISGQVNNSYNIPSAAFADTGKYRVIITGTCGTDTSNYASLTVAGSLTFSQQPVSQTVCLGHAASFSVVANGANTTYQWKKDGQNITGANAATYTINSVATTDTGSYSCSVTSSCGNAVSGSATLTINFPTSFSFSQTICAGSSFNFNGHSLTTQGTYHDTLSNAHFCDSVITLTLTVTPAPVYTYSDSTCSGNPYNFNGTQLTTAGTYRDTVTTNSGCDSIVVLHLSIKQTSTSITNAAICQGGAYHFNGMNLTTAGNYQDTLTGSHGCDSIAYLHLTVNQPSTNTVYASMCGSRSYNFNGRILSSPGTYTDTLLNARGCDSIITLNLSTSPTVSYAYNASICAGGIYNFNGRIVSSAGSYFDTIPVSGGCDSVVVLHLTVNQLTGSTINATICSNGSYTFNGRALHTTGTYYDTLNNAHGCDSIITLNLTVTPPITTSLNASICSGRSYSFNGQQLTTSGTYTAHYTAAGGCDSTVTLTLQVGPYVIHTINASVCSGSSYSFNGRQLNSAGTYKDTLTAQGGCDSIITLQLSVTPPSTGSVHAAICSGGSYNFHGRQLTTAGNYNDTLTGSNGCDSILTLTLQVNSFLTTNLMDTICQGSSYNFNGQNLTTTGVYRDTLTAQGGCDSVVTLNLMVAHNSGSTINATICVGSTYQFNGVPLGSTGTYFEALNGINGCDSIVTLHLVVNSFITTNQAASICYGTTYSFYGRTLNATGTYTDTLQAQGGCDSIIALALTVNPIITHNITAAICPNGSYNFNGRHLNIPGTYRDTLVTTGGCDSLVILTLDTTSVVTTTVNTSICNGSTYNFNGRTLSASGIYTDTLTALGGCDSIVTLHLGLYQTYNMGTNQSICQGDTFLFQGHPFSAAGIYSDTLTSVHGCDSVLTLNLTVKSLPDITWAQPDTICNNNDSTHLTLVPPVPIDGTLSGAGLHGLVLTVSASGGTYPVTYAYTDSAGCTASITKNLIVESCLGIQQLTMEAAIFIYPNPANNMVTAEADIFANGHTAPVVYNMMGKAVMVPFIQQANKFNFNTESLATGVYLIKFNIGGNIVTKHFVKAD